MIRAPLLALLLLQSKFALVSLVAIAFYVDAIYKQHRLVFGALAVLLLIRPWTRQAAMARPENVKLAAPQQQNSVRYFTDWALPQLDLILPENDKPIEVWTTLDPIAQKAAIEARMADWAADVGMFE